MMSPSDHSSPSASVGLPPPVPEPKTAPAAFADDEVFRKSTLGAGRWTAVIGMLLVLAALLALLCLQFGTQFVGLNEMARIFARMVEATSDRRSESDVMATILLQVRLPRIFLGFLVGGCLAAVGVALQALLRNPLADPYVLGVSSGAALGVSVAVLFGVGTTVMAMSALPLCGFAGSVVALALMYRMAASYDRLPIHSVLLAGVILNAIFSALIMFITSIMDPNRSFGMMIWLMGSLMAPAYPTLLVFSLYAAVCLTLLFGQVNVLNVMAYGEEPARSLGVDTELAKRRILLFSALMTGAVVSVSGMVGFIGMVIPHAVRLMVGADHRLVMPASALIGGTFLMVADTFARTVVSPSELPVGIMTALVGGPFFVYLLAWRKDRMS
ncbi:Vitamin B12 import system, permease protein BtuC [Nitrospira japonica]|uniref:Vitamin B12 import system, permease protein BtuC n=1 Tax=Nitrospira japonica TaxID=1325564 RepID=A0A1W1I9Q6_9BACT|nr:Vitamin B12 import system, permease protein BtuC [Nitrospira japonica]